MLTDIGDTVCVELLLEDSNVFGVTIKIRHKQIEGFIPSIKLVEGNPDEIRSSGTGLRDHMGSSPPVKNTHNQNVMVTNVDSIETS